MPPQSSMASTGSRRVFVVSWHIDIVGNACFMECWGGVVQANATPRHRKECASPPTPPALVLVQLRLMRVFLQSSTDKLCFRFSVRMDRSSIHGVDGVEGGALGVKQRTLSRLLVQHTRFQSMLHALRERIASGDHVLLLLPSFAPPSHRACRRVLEWSIVNAMRTTVEYTLVDVKEYLVVDYVTFMSHEATYRELCRHYELPARENGKASMRERKRHIVAAYATLLHETNVEKMPCTAWMGVLSYFRAHQQSRLCKELRAQRLEPSALCVGAAHDHVDTVSRGVGGNASGGVRTGKTSEKTHRDVENATKKCEYVVYCIFAEDKRISYVGCTNNFPRRLRQHRGELCGGAKYTKKSRAWVPGIMVTGFLSKGDALSFEQQWKRSKPFPKAFGRGVQFDREHASLRRRLRALLTLYRTNRFRVDIHYLFCASDERVVLNSFSTPS